MKNEGVGVACHSSFIYSYFLVIQWAAPPSISHHQTQNAPLGKPILDTPQKKKHGSKHSKVVPSQLQVGDHPGLQVIEPWSVPGSH